MCLLSFFPARIGPDPDALRAGAWANPHGHGFAIVTGDRILTGHGMRGPQVIDAFTQLRARYPDGPALFHSRYATHGVIDLGNCHPFHLGGDERTVVAHNGTLPKRVHPGPYDPRSDTRIAAEDYLPGQPFGSLDSVRGFRGLESWLGRSKMVILTLDPAFEQRVYLLNEHLGYWDNGAWYSNLSYLPPTRRPNSWRTVLCGHCGHIDIHRIGRYCHACGWCSACQHPFPYCECHTNTRRRAQPTSARPGNRRARA